MKKFTNLEKIEELKTVNPKITKLVEKLVSLNLSVSYSGDENDIIGKDIKIDGIDKLIENLELTIDWNNVQTFSKIVENVKYNPLIKSNQVELNEKINQLKELKHDSIIYSPEDIFESSDYTKSNKLFVLESMKSIPMDFLHKVNKREVSSYFEKGNKIEIIYEGVDKGWNLSFKKSDDYGTMTDAENVKYDFFIKENADFIADFVSATSLLIGSKNLKLETKLIK